MQIDINVHLHGGADVKDLLLLLLSQGLKMTQQLEALKTAVAAEATVIDSAITLLNGLSDQIKSLKDDPPALEALAKSVKEKSEALAAAVVANT